MPHNAPRLGSQAHVGAQQGIPAQADFEVVHQGYADDGQKAAQKAAPGPPGEKVEQPDQQHGGQQVEEQNQGIVKVRV